MSRETVLANVVVQRASAIARLAKAKSTAKRNADIATNTETLIGAANELAGLVAAPSEPTTPTHLPPTSSEIPGAPSPAQIAEYEVAKEKFLDAQDRVFIEQGKLHGRDGAERAAMSREEGINLAKSVGVYEILVKNYPTFFGPDLGPDVSQ